MLNLKELYKFYKKLISENYSQSDIDLVCEMIAEKEGLLLETSTSATGGPSGSLGAGMVGYGSQGTSLGVGPVPSSNPLRTSGGLNGNWVDGKKGSDISVPYNPGGSDRMFQKVPSPMGKNHGAKTGKKSRVKPLDLKALKNIFAKKQQDKTMGQSEKPKKVMNFDDFAKGELNTVTKLKEGKAYKATKSPTDKKVGKEGLNLTNRKETFRSKVQNLLNSHKGLEVKRVGDDFEVSKDGDTILQVMFRQEYIGLKKTGAKFTDEFKYDELGKIKSKIGEIVK